MEKKYDFGGWATKANMKCSDGRVIKKNAFAECDGVIVPLVWNHQHNSPDQVLGHALLENREDMHMEPLTIQRLARMQNYLSRTVM